MKRKIHLFAAIVSTLCIATFFISTIIVELFGSKEAISLVKTWIVAPGLYILVLAMILVGSTGFSASKNRQGQLITNKKKRMPFIAINGLFILIPCAITLNHWAAAGMFDMKFYIVQGVELIAGATNLTLMGLNIRDGFQMTGKIQRHSSS